MCNESVYMCENLYRTQNTYVRLSNMKRRLLALLLCALLLTPGMIGCSGGETEENKQETTASDKTTETVEETAPLTEYEKRQLIPDELEDNDFGGQNFRVITTAHDTYDAVTFEIVAEELNGDACNDAVYNRNLEIENRFNAVVTCIAEKEPYKIVKNAVTSGSDDYDLTAIYDYMTYQLVSAEAVMNWMEVPHIHMEKPWHNALANQNATINNRLYAICSDLSITSMTYTYATFFNVKMMEGYGYPSDTLYDLVREGKWTIDTLSEIVSGIYTDVNGDGKADKEDIFGYGYQITNPADVWMTSFDQPLFTIDADNTYTINFMSEKTTAILEKLLDFHYNNPGVFLPSTQYDEQIYFLNGQFAMAPLRFHCAYTKLRDMEDPYSMLPYPKWDEQQSTYYTNADDKFSVFLIPLTAANNVDFIGTIFEALSAISYKKVYPEYYDVALKGKYSTDASTAEMIDLIMAGRNFDFTFQFGETYFQRLPYLIRDLILNKNANLASKYDSIKEKLYTQIDEKLLPLYGVEK